MTKQDPTPELSRRERGRQETIAEILHTARKIMREEGVGGLTIHELARRMGMQPPSLYNYFDGLMDIYDALFRLGFERWDAYVREYTAGAEGWRDQFRLAMEAYLTFAIQNPELYQLCFERPVPGFEPTPESLKVSTDNLQAWVARIAGFKDQLDTDLPAEQLTDLLISLSHGITALHMANQPGLPLGEGRFGSLIPAAVELIDQAWSQD
ncbi:MAG: TetR/AcrR family transcriptional regulator [Anaerolineales bacterium]|nr:TetR/AcrR family transcriptional regulator [Anaerolineales bacterium]